MRVKNIIRAVACLVAAFFFCLLFVGRTTTTGGRAGAQAGAQGDKPVEQTRKNIQVLKGLPSSRLFEVMNFVSVSLGVHCQHCHVKQGAGGDDWVWESDDKPTKRTARRMMRMVLETNRNNLDAFRGAGVTCYTCHRGATAPERFPSMPLAVSGHEGSDPAAAKSAAEATPTAEQVLSRYVDAVGGRAAVAKLKTRVLKGTRDASQGRSWPMELSVKEPGKYLMVLNIPEQGELRRGADGARGWVRTRGVAREMTPAEVESLRDAVMLSAPVSIREPFPQMTPAGVEKVGERAAYVLEHRPSAGVRELYYFDRETGLLLRRKNYRDTVLFPVPEQFDFEDYRDVDGLKLPFTVRYSNIDTWFSFTRKFTGIKHNVALDDALFSPPPAPTP